jgi:4Fe-4S ferredoxin
MELKVNQDNCLGCGVCVISCPVNAEISPENAGGNGSKTEEVITMIENGFVKIFCADKCKKCGTCQMFCPCDAIWLE